MSQERPLFEAIGSNVIRLNFRSAEDMLCDKYGTSDVCSAIRQYPEAAYEFIRYFRYFIAIDLVEKQFIALEAIRQSPQAAEYFLQHQIEYRWHLIGFHIALRAAEEREE
ncbi:hypothetical protein JW752_03505 [Candidatus Peregrinibacteria bacterium]|nr:hypothetical protein [Candidatus Peregrinibacteria bacterium]